MLIHYGTQMTKPGGIEEGEAPERSRRDRRDLRQGPLRNDVYHFWGYDSDSRRPSEEKQWPSRTPDVKEIT